MYPVDLLVVCTHSRCVCTHTVPRYGRRCTAVCTHSRSTGSCVCTHTSRVRARSSAGRYHGSVRHRARGLFIASSFNDGYHRGSLYEDRSNEESRVDLYLEWSHQAEARQPSDQRGAGTKEAPVTDEFLTVTPFLLFCGDGTSHSMFNTGFPR